MRLSFATLAALVAGTSVAAAQPAEWVPKFVVVNKPADIAAAYPKAARDAKIGGEVVLGCIAQADGALKDCAVVKEEPAGHGFGEAALRLVGKERIQPKDAAGASVAGRPVRTYFPFMAPGDSNPNWLKRPTAEDLDAVFPTAAATKRVDGRATMACEVSVEGFLERCKVEAEEPAGLGFGAAALHLAPQFRMTPKIRNGKAERGTVTIPIIWEGFAHNNDSVSEAAMMSLVLDPPWVSVPSAQQVRAAWPAAAKDAKFGQVALRCAFGREGELKDCVTISEIPSGQGFAKAARTLIPAFKVRFAADQAKALKTYRVDVPFRFRAPSEPDARKVTNPKWVRGLTVEGMAAVYPQAALAAGKHSGLGVVACVINLQGELTDCEVRREDPVALDFGAAAMKAAEAMLINPWSTEGEPLEGVRLILPIRFNWATETPAAKP